MIELYTKKNCSFCTKAKNLLRDTGNAFVENVLNEDFTTEYLKENYKNATTYPVVIVDGFHIGGYAELKEMIMSQQDSKKFLAE